MTFTREELKRLALPALISLVLTAAGLGFSKADYLLDTYRDLFEAWLERTGSDVAHMTFD